jgi:hypothetical protein
MFDKLLHHKLLTEGLEAEGVITEQRVEAAKGELGVMGFYIGIEGHVRFADGTEARFSSKGLDTSKVGDLNVGAIVPVRYSADRTHAVLDVPKLEAATAAKKQAADKWLERRKAEQIAAADAALAKGGKSGHHDRGTGPR